MSLEDQYDAWVRSVTGTGRHSATKQDRDAAQNSLNAMQAQLDALAESQKRQKSAADALNAVQRAGAATADSVRRMSSELTQSLRQDGLLGGKTAQPAPAAEPVKVGPENFNGLADRVRQQVLGQDALCGAGGQGVPPPLCDGHRRYRPCPRQHAAVRPHRYRAALCPDLHCGRDGRPRTFAQRPD